MNKYQVDSVGIIKYINGKDIKNDIAIYKAPNTRLCWFCQKECYDFIAICAYCKYDRKKKKKKIN